MQKNKKQIPQVTCDYCHHEFVTMPYLPYCRFCGGVVRPNQAWIDEPIDDPDNSDNDNDNSD